MLNKLSQHRPFGAGPPFRYLFSRWPLRYRKTNHLHSGRCCRALTSMAGYHYKLQIIPGDYVVSGEKDENFWLSKQPDSGMLNRYRKLLPDENHWGETEEFRSNNNYSVLYIWWEDGRVWNIQFEYAPVVDKRDELLIEILSLCNKYGYKFYSERSYSAVYPSKEALWDDFIKGHPYALYERQGLSEFK